jgi:hypothetical protein
VVLIGSEQYWGGLYTFEKGILSIEEACIDNLEACCVCHMYILRAAWDN